MASIRRHARSPYWYLRKRDLETGQWCEQSTGLRADNAKNTLKAERLARNSSVQESRIREFGNSAFNAWVPGYLATHWKSTTAGTGKRMQVAWQAIRLFLRETDLIYPRQIAYRHAQDYLSWRKSNSVHGRRVGHNTALLELKFLSQLLNEAVRHAHAEANPLIRLGIPRAPQKIKPELSDEQICLLLHRCQEQPKWAERAIWIATYTGCRFMECQIESKHINMIEATLTITDAKRNESDPRKFFTVPIPCALRWIFEEMDRNKETITCNLSGDKNGRINKFIRSCGIDASFHCFRVTFITRCHRAGLTMFEAMRLVNHSSQLVHGIYSRLNVDDVRAARAKIQLPSVEPRMREPK